MPRLALIGECMVELAGTGQPDRYALGFAGDTFNTAWYARRLLPEGWQVDYVTAVGRDALSDRMVAAARDAGIGTAHIARRSDRTLGLYMISVDDGERAFSYWRGQSAARLLANDTGALAVACAGAETLYFSGITLAVLEGGGRAALFGALEAARRAGTAVAFDPNLRPALWPNAVAMRGAVMQAARLSDILLPSFDDEAAHFGDASPEATAERYRAAGAGLVVVKNGSGTIHATQGDEVAAVVPPPVAEVVDTTAAGDGFNAGFLAAHLTGAGLTDSVSAGAALAARVVQAHGALVEV